MGKDFEDTLTKAKEQTFKESVIKASKILGLPRPPKVKIWDGGCPYSHGNEIAHAHPDIGLICISRSRLKAMSIDEIEETAVHETTHMIHIGHDADFQTTMSNAELVSWVLSHMHRPGKIKLKGTIKSDKNVCNYHLCRKKTKLYKCKYCGNYFCKKHIKPIMALTLHQVSTAKEPLRSWLEKEYRRKDGHPDFVYTKVAWERLEKKKAEEMNKFLKALDELKAMKKVPPPPEPIHEEAIPPIEPPIKRRIPTKTVIVIVIIALIGLYLYNNPQILSNVKNGVGSLLAGANLTKEMTTEQKCEKNVKSELEKLKEISLIPFSYEVLDIQAFGDIDSALMYAENKWYVSLLYTYNYKQYNATPKNVIQVIARITFRSQTGEVRLVLPIICDSYGNLIQESYNLLRIIKIA